MKAHYLPLITSLLFSAPLAYSENLQLPDMGDSTGTLISPAQEKALGQSFFRSIRSQLTISYDADIQNYIQDIGRRLVTNSDNPYQYFYFFVVLSDDINAFAGPGGFIGINSGLILNSESESELASVMAHEIAHVTQRHIYRAYEAATRLSLPAAAAMIAAIVVATQAPDVGIGAISAVQAGSVQMQIDFTRDNEQEADRIGLKTLAKSQFDPRSMPKFFERLQQASRYYGQGAPEFLRTHPITTSRISDTRGRAETYPYRQVPDSQYYRLIKAKLRTLSNTPADDLIRYFKHQLNQGTPLQRAAMEYGLALSYVKQQNFKAAKTHLLTLAKQFPQQPQYLSALTHIASLQNNFKQAAAYSLQLQRQFPNNISFKFDYIDNLLNSRQAKLALQFLKTTDYKHQQQPRFYLLQARAYGDLDHALNSHRYMAEYYYSTGQIHAAVEQIKLARRQKGLNFYLAAILDDRLLYFKQEIKALKELQK